MLGMSASPKTKLSSAETFALLGRVSKLVSTTVDRAWESDIAAHIAFLILGAEEEWALDDDQGKEDASSPESAVSVRRWSLVLRDMTKIPSSQIRIAKVRILNSMGRGRRPAERRPPHHGTP